MPAGRPLESRLLAGEGAQDGQHGEREDEDHGCGGERDGE
jgi:hypothetical protein